MTVKIQITVSLLDLTKMRLCELLLKNAIKED